MLVVDLFCEFFGVSEVELGKVFGWGFVWYWVCVGVCCVGVCGK